MKLTTIAALSLPLVITACASIDSGSITHPRGSAGYSGERQAFVAMGRELWNDTSLGKSGLACGNCHVGGAQFRNTFEQAYPHSVDDLDCQIEITNDIA